MAEPRTRVNDTVVDPDVCRCCGAKDIRAQPCDCAEVLHWFMSEDGSVICQRHQIQQWAREGLSK